MDCRKFVLVAAVMAGCCMKMAAQTDAGLSESYAKRYNLIVSKLGYDGVGVETVLTQWEKADSLNTDMLTAWFNYWFTKAQSEEVVVKTQKRYLGAEPLLSLKDSTGADIYYFQEVFYDDGMFSKAMKYLDKAISEEPLRLDLRFTKVASLMSYEKDSPDMALSYLLALADRNAGEDCKWEYPGFEISEDFFTQAMQEYCFAFYRLGTPSSYNAFRTLSERMLLDDPKNTVFLTNMGTYDFIVAKDFKSALKYYKKALKIAPDDYTALKNCVLLARQQKNKNMEKKYLASFVKVAAEDEKAAAEARLQYLQ